jgi:hypothetical protein
MSQSFLYQCKQNFFNGITPSNKNSREKDGYKLLVSIALEHFENNRYKDFSCYLTEGQYFASLWAAHMIVEFGKPDPSLLVSALKVIREHSDNPLSPEVAKEEREWLDLNKDRWENIQNFYL